jgi:hypothetical protein
VHATSPKLRPHQPTDMREIMLIIGDDEPVDQVIAA